MTIKKTTYQYCQCIGVKQNLMYNGVEFYCYKVLPDGTVSEFTIYPDEIDMIIYCNYDMGYGERTYIRVNGEYQYYGKFDSDFDRFVSCSSDESRNKMFELLRVRYPNANITIFEDDSMCVYNNRLIDCINYERGRT